MCDDSALRAGQNIHGNLALYTYQMNQAFHLLIALLLCLLSCSAFTIDSSGRMGFSSLVRNKNTGDVNRVTIGQKKYLQKSSSLQMNFFEDAFRYFSQLNKEASAKHILIKVFTVIAIFENLFHST